MAFGLGFLGAPLRGMLGGAAPIAGLSPGGGGGMMGLGAMPPGTFAGGFGLGAALARAQAAGTATGKTGGVTGKKKKKGVGTLLAPAALVKNPGMMGGGY